MSGRSESERTGCHSDVTCLSTCLFFSRVHSSNQKNEEKRGGSGSNNWSSTKEEARLVYFCVLQVFFLCTKLELGKTGYFVVVRVSFGVLSETEQPAAPETTTEGEETAPAGSENK